MKVVLMALALLISTVSASAFTTEICGRDKEVLQFADGNCLRVYFNYQGGSYSGVLVSASRAIGKAQVTIDDCDMEYLTTLVISLRSIYEQEAIDCYTLQTL